MAMVLASILAGCASGRSARLGEPMASKPVISGTVALTVAEARAPVTIYGVEWCGPCHQAAAFLDQRGIPYVERNIEGDEGAKEEMRFKLERAGLRGGSIPVLDVNGMILVGFDPNHVARALARPL